MPCTKGGILYKLDWMGSENMEMPLSCLQEGQCGSITRLATETVLHRRLLDFGLTAGTAVCCLRKGPAGDPVLYRFRGTVLALRRRDSSCVYVEVAL